MLHFCCVRQHHMCVIAAVLTLPFSGEIEAEPLELAAQQSGFPCRIRCATPPCCSTLAHGKAFVLAPASAHLISSGTSGLVEGMQVCLGAELVLRPLQEAVLPEVDGISARDLIRHLKAVTGQSYVEVG